MMTDIGIEGNRELLWIITSLKQPSHQAIYIKVDEEETLCT